MVEIKQISMALQEINYSYLIELIETALAEGISANVILNEGLIKGMEAVGEKFKIGELFIPEVVAIGNGMQQALKILKPKLIESEGKVIGEIILGTVKGDLHDLGKNLVKMMFEGAGFVVHDLGIDVHAERFVNAVRTSNSQVIGMSGLLTTTMGYMKEVIEAIIKEGLREKVKIIVGGAPVTQTFAEQIGADGYAPDAILAVEKIRKWL